MQLKGVLISFIILFLFSVKAQLTEVYGEADYPFLLNLPNDSVLKSKPPLLIFLHGRSLSGNNLEKVKRYGIISEILKGRDIPAIVIAPQVNMGQSWEPDKVLTLVNYIENNYNIDSNRIYVAGMSLGGYGTLHFSGKYPEIVAGAIALCGGGNPIDGCNLSQIPVWIQHGRLDRAVPISESEKMVEAIKNCNGGENLIYTEYPTYGHGELERVFHTDEFYEWLFSKVKDPTLFVQKETNIECGFEEYEY